MGKWKLESVKLLNDPKFSHSQFGNYYLEVSYIHETDKDIRRVVIPKIDLPIKVFDEPIITQCIEPSDSITYEPPHIDIGFGPCMMLRDKDGHRYIETITKVKTKKMTLAEIEEKLGYKIELVSDKED